MSDRWEIVKRLVGDALDHPPDERSAFLDAACDDASVRREVEGLVAADERAGDFLAAPPPVSGTCDEEAATLRLTRLCVRCGARYGSTCDACSVDGSSLVEDPAALVNTALGAYDVTGLLGAGGMGEVYLATDTRLRRRVALKLLPASVSRDKGRLRRFEVEARAAAKLSHPNVCMVHELGETDDGRHFIAMEYVEGRTLRSRLAEGRLTLAEALDVARQVAHALAAAHEAGVVHRDVKPENVMLRPDGYVKVLDFGLAKLTEVEAPLDGPDAAAGSMAGGKSVTRGVVGTIGYMSPEQAAGRPVDARSDVFSFGAVLYELLAGERAFARATEAETLYATIHDEPSGLAALAGAVPEGVGEVVRRCLAKAPERRYASATALAAALDEQVESFRSSGAAAAVVPGPRLRRPWWLALAGAAALAAGGAWLWTANPMERAGSQLADDEPLAPMKMTILTSIQGLASTPKFSPDGTQVAFGATSAREVSWRIYVKPIDGGSERQLVTTPGEDLSPTWSPDGRSVAFTRQHEGTRAIYTVSLEDGRERKLVATMMDVMGWEVIDWSPTGEFIAYSDTDEPGKPWRIYLVSVETGETRQLTFAPDGSHLGIGDWSAAFSPDGQSLAFVRQLRPSVADVYVVPVAGGEARRLTFDSQHIIGLTWTSDGRGIVFASARRGPMSLWRIAPEGGEPRALEAGGLRGIFPTISRDGRRLAYVISSGGSSTWLFELPRHRGPSVPPTQLFTSASTDGRMRYSPDGTTIAFTSGRSGASRIWVCDADGSNARQVPGVDYAVDSPPSWSPDARELAFDALPEGNADIYVTGVDGGPPRRLTDDPSDDALPTWSRDGRWIYFVSERSGDLQLWKVSPGGGEAVQVTHDGVSGPAQESRDGRYLYYLHKRGVAGLWRVSVDGGQEELVSDRLGASGWPGWALADDGVYFGERTDDGAVISFYSFATRRVRRIGTVEDSVGTAPGITLSPDGRRLLYWKGDRLEYNITLAENVRL